MREYVLSRFSHLNVPSMTSHNILGELNKSRGPFQSNWDFRKLPTPPGSYVDEKEMAEMRSMAQNQAPKAFSAPKKLETPNIARSLQSFTSVMPEASTIKSTRRQSIKFVDMPVQLKRSTSRQSVVLMDIDNQSESTDL
jgi:hypothetical protein